MRTGLHRSLGSELVRTTRAVCLSLGCGLLVVSGCGRSKSTVDGVDAGAGRETTTGGTGLTHAGGTSAAGGADGGTTTRAGGAGMRNAGAGGVGTGGRGGTGGGGGMTSPAGHGGVAGPGGTGATAGEGEAGAVGAAGDSGEPEGCTVTVPANGEMGALQAAIDAAPARSTLCLEAGAYRGDVTLRPGVNLKGVGWASVICGAVNGDQAVAIVTNVSDLQIEGPVSAAGNVQLNLLDLEINTGHTAICAPSSEPVRIVHDGGGLLDVVIDGVTVNSPGFEISVTPGGEHVDASIVVTRSRCDSTSQCYDFLRFTFDTAPAAQAAAGSFLWLDVFNNVVRNVVLEGVVFDVKGGLSAEDAANSKLWFRHNTLASAGDLNSAIAFYTPPTLPVVLANNAVVYIATPVLNGDAPTITQAGNVFSEDESSTAWFTDFALGDFTPSADSPLIGAGVDEYGVPDDIVGTPRAGGFDSGAYQR